MDKTELRIGNIVGATIAGEIHGKLAEYVIKDGKDIDNAAWYFPIPLTKEKLIEIGATGSDGPYLSYLLGELQLCRDGGNLYFYGNSGPIGMPLEYVHQIQNSYYELTRSKTTPKNE
ncbi:MAG TPA: hypothetical protein PK289_00960 [Bacteroidia bacterium]|nr:hypothetical protein [Bacteroidia bacterium]